MKEFQQRLKSELKPILADIEQQRAEADAASEVEKNAAELKLARLAESKRIAVEFATQILDPLGRTIGDEFPNAKSHFTTEYDGDTIRWWGTAGWTLEVENNTISLEILYKPDKLELRAHVYVGLGPTFYEKRDVDIASFDPKAAQDWFQTQGLAAAKHFLSHKK